MRLRPEQQENERQHQESVTFFAVCMKHDQNVERNKFELLHLLLTGHCYRELAVVIFYIYPFFFCMANFTYKSKYKYFRHFIVNFKSKYFSLDSIQLHDFSNMARKSQYTELFLIKLSFVTSVGEGNCHRASNSRAGQTLCNIPPMCRIHVPPSVVVYLFLALLQLSSKLIQH